ncbi:MAG: ABC transporter substrate-binding protein [Chloroflexota bacterium]
MTRTDSFVVGTLVVLLALIAGLVSAPSLFPATATVATPQPTPGPVAVRPYREGVLGHPVSVSPLSAKTQADRDLVALVFSGLVRNGPNGTLVPDLAEHWSVDPTGTKWTFQLRDDAFWHDGEPVTSDDVAYTIRVLQDKAYTGPAARSWNEVTVQTEGPRMITFTLATPLGGFLQLATQPIAPEHLLASVPISELPEAPFGRQPIGSGPFAVASLDDGHAELIPAATMLQAEAPTAAPTAGSTDSLATPVATARPTRPVPYLSGMDFTFYDDPDTLADAFRAGGLDAASGLTPAVNRDLARDPGTRSLNYPGATMTAVLLNLRPGHPEFANPAVRTALLQAIDRVQLASDAFAAGAAVSSGPIPPSSAMFDPVADPPVAFDPTAAENALKAAGWVKAADGWRLPKVKAPLAIELVSPDQASNPPAFAAAEAVTRDWTSLGLRVTHVALPPGDFVTGRLATGKFQVAVGDVTVGLDPDLYPLLASSQTVTGGSNVIGLQDPALDKLLAAARGPGSDVQRKAAYSALQVALAKGRYVLPLAFADESIVVRDTLEGPTVRQVADPADRFWDVLTWRLAAGR